jgi:hypothetical protein
MGTVGFHLYDHLENGQDLLVSKSIVSFQAVKEFFKNVFFNVIDEVEDSKASFTEKKDEIHFYCGDLSMAVINQGENITIWKLNPLDSKIMAILNFEAGHCFIKYVNPVKVMYLSEAEIEDIFRITFLQPSKIH